MALRATVGPSPTTDQSMNLVTAIVEATMLLFVVGITSFMIGGMFGVLLMALLRANGPDTEPQYETGDELE